MQVLYYSSDPNIQWPPENTSPSPSQMLGHMEQLGKYQPREKVEVAYKKGFPSAGDFYKNFVERQRPVIFANAVDNSDYNFLKLANLNQSTRAGLSFTDISSFTKIEKQPESLWHFINEKINKINHDNSAPIYPGFHTYGVRVDTITTIADNGEEVKTSTKSHR